MRLTSMANEMNVHISARCTGYVLGCPRQMTEPENTLFTYLSISSKRIPTTSLRRRYDVIDVFSLAIFCELTKPFDSLQHAFLFDKLCRCGIRSNSTFIRKVKLTIFLVFYTIL